MDCTLIDCGANLSTRTEAFVELMDGYVGPSVKVCVDEVCSTVTGAARRGLAFSTQGLEPGRHPIDVFVYEGAVLQSEHSCEIELEAFKPNGADCDPTCAAGVGRFVPDAAPGEQIVNDN